MKPSGFILFGKRAGFRFIARSNSSQRSIFNQFQIIGKFVRDLSAAQNSPPD
jgi:hypothetical protein